MPRLPSLPSVDIFANETGSITLSTTDAATGTQSAVHLPLELIPGILVLLKSTMEQMNQSNQSSQINQSKLSNQEQAEADISRSNIDQC
jgi:hypothetical protein